MGCLSDYGYCLGGCDMQAIDNQPIRLIQISFFLFSQLPRIGQNLPYFGVSVGCLEGVWEVSGGCLAHSGLCLGHIDAKLIAISPVGMINLVYFIFFQLIFFGLAVLHGQKLLTPQNRPKFDKINCFLTFWTNRNKKTTGRTLEELLGAVRPTLGGGGESKRRNWMTSFVNSP